MPKDKRFLHAKHLILTGYVKTFREIFDDNVLPKSSVYKELGINNVRFNKLIANVDSFVVKDLFRIAALLEIDEKMILDLVHAQYQADKKAKKKR